MASIKGCYQPKTKSFDDLTKERKERKEKKTKKKRKKEKREKRGGVAGSQGRRRERVHGIKRKERRSPTSHHEPP